MTQTLHDLLASPFGHIINGALTQDGMQTATILNPASNSVLAKVPVAGRETLDTAVASAQTAFRSWKHTTWSERTSLLLRWADSFQAQTTSMAALLSAEQGKTIGTAEWEVHAALHWIRQMPTMTLDEYLVFESDEKCAVQRYTPLGVCAGIVPWNFPVLLMMFKVVPALLTGNTIIIKPSPFTPLSTCRIIQAAQDVFPPGVLQCVLGNDALGPWMTEHEGIVRISFTGSTETGKLVARSCAGTLKRLSLELGGNDAAIIMPDLDEAAGDIDRVAGMMIQSSFMNTGQWCQASKRIYVHERVYDRFRASFVDQLRKTVIGPADRSDVTHGPINNGPQVKKINDLIDDSKQHNHTIFSVGQVIAPKQANCLPFTVVDDPPEQSRIVQEEPFGPLIPLLRWSDETDLLERVNASPYGLGAIIHGREDADAERIARQLEVGTVWKNMIQFSDPLIPFHGWKMSGYGGENGVEVLKSYSNVQVIITAK